MDNEMVASQAKEVFKKDRSILDIEDIPEIHDMFRVTDSKEGFEPIFESNPSDMLVMTEELLERFFEITKQAGYDDVYGIPSDIFEADTIPLPDSVILYDGDCYIRVVVAEDVYLTYETGSFNVTFKSLYDEENGLVMLSVDDAYSSDKEFVELFASRSNMTGFMILVDQFFKLWYAFQICLLNPPVKERILKKSGKMKLGGACHTDKKDGRKARYVKYHEVRSDIFETATDGDGFERKTLSWYVIGHWRNYRNGKKTFVNGYWKGPLRQAKMNSDSGRIREVS